MSTRKELFEDVPSVTRSPKKLPKLKPLKPRSVQENPSSVSPSSFKGTKSFLPTKPGKSTRPSIYFKAPKAITKYKKRLNKVKMKAH